MSESKTMNMGPALTKGTARTECGAYITEFASSFFMLISIVLPLLNMSVIPLRFGMGKSIVSNEVRRLGHYETLSEAMKKSNDDAAGLAAMQKIGGLVVKSSQLALTIESMKNKGHSLLIDKPGSIPKNWLPDGSEGPCMYMLDLKVDVEISPLVAVPGPVQIPGLTGPLPIRFHEVSAFENLGCDPETGRFCIDQ